MDGDVTSVEARKLDAVARESADQPHTTRRRPRTLLWLIVVGLLLTIVLGGLYGFIRFREQATVASSRAISRRRRRSRPLSRPVRQCRVTAAGIGSLAAVHQVTITPEIGGRVTAIMFEPEPWLKPATRWYSSTTGPERGDRANYEAQARWASISLQRSQTLRERQVVAQETVDQNQTQLDQARAQIIKDRCDHRAKADPGAVRRPARRAADRARSVRQSGAAAVTLTDLHQLYVNFTLPSTMRAQIKLGQDVNVRPTDSPAARSRRRSRRSSRRSAPTPGRSTCRRRWPTRTKALLPACSSTPRSSCRPSPTASCCRRRQSTTRFTVTASM